METLQLSDEFKINTPDSWDISRDGNLTSLYDGTNGMGALQFSPFKVPNINSIDLVKELQDYLEDKYENINAELVENYAYFSIADHEIYWRYWLLKGKNSMIFITYNCDSADEGKEDEIVNKIIASIQW